MVSLLTAYAHQPQILLIIALIFVLMELTDGSTIFFLPLGLGAGVMSLYIYLVNETILPPVLLSPTWYGTILLWAVFALVISLALTRVRKNKARQTSTTADSRDINDY